MMSCYYYSLHIAGCYIHLGCYMHNASIAVPSSLLRVPFVVLANLPGILNSVLYLNHMVAGGDYFHSAIHGL